MGNNRSGSQKSRGNCAKPAAQESMVHAKQFAFDVTRCVLVSLDASAGSATLSDVFVRQLLATVSTQVSIKRVLPVPESGGTKGRHIVREF